MNNYDQIIDVAENLIQTNGYNAFSFRDIAKIVGIKTASIHYHFPTKADLGKAVVKKHIELLAMEVSKLLEDSKLNAKTKIERVLELLIQKTFSDNQKMCLGGMLAADFATLPKVIQKAVQDFFKRLENWIHFILSDGIHKKELKIQEKNIQKEVQLVLAIFEGSLLLARLNQDEGFLTTARKEILGRLVKD